MSAYCVRACVCKIKHFTEREFSGIFSLAGEEICVFKTGIPGGPDLRTLLANDRNVKVDL